MAAIINPERQRRTRQCAVHGGMFWQLLGQGSLGWVPQLWSLCGKVGSVYARHGTGRGSKGIQKEEPI